MEYWDLYDINKVKLDQRIKKGEKCPEGTYRLLVHVVLFNKEGKMLIQYRHPKKKLDPGIWDLSVGGSVISGEYSYEGAMRETKEELGIDIDLYQCRPNLTIHVFDCFNDVYIADGIECDEFKPGKDEVLEVKWVSKDEIMELIDLHQFVPYYKSYIDLLFHLRNYPGVHQ